MARPEPATTGFPLPSLPASRRSCAARFHHAERDNVVDCKLRALDNLYTMLQQDRTNRVTIILKLAIVALFIIDFIVTPGLK